MSNADTSFLRMETPDSLMVIPILFVFEEQVPYERMRRLLKFDRFTQRIVSSPRKSDNPARGKYSNFNMDEHLSEVILPQPEGDAELREFINSQVGIPLDYSKPLWEAPLIKKYNSGSALLFRVHHCLADGFSLLVVGSSLGDLTREGTPDSGSVPEKGTVDNQDIEQIKKSMLQTILK